MRHVELAADARQIEQLRLGLGLGLWFGFGLRFGFGLAFGLGLGFGLALGFGLGWGLGLGANPNPSSPARRRAVRSTRW